LTAPVFGLYLKAKGGLGELPMVTLFECRTLMATCFLGMRLYWLLVFFWMMLCPSFAKASRWQTLKTDSFTVFYKPGDEGRANRLLAAMERGRPAVERLTGNHARHDPLVIQDMGSMVNSLTDPLNGVIQIFPCPPNSRDSLSAGDWFLMVGTHEYVHALNLSKVNGLSGIAKRLLGTSVNSNLLNPGWSMEGLAVYGESQIASREGRLNDGYFDAVAASQSGIKERLSLMRSTYLPWESPAGFQYIAGGLFHGYLSQTYGPESMTRFYLAHGLPFLQWLSPLFPTAGLDCVARKIFGESISNLWKDWRQSVIMKGPPVVEGQERLTKRGWTMDGLQISKGKAYYLSTVPVKTASQTGFTFYQVVERDLDSGRERVLVSQTAYFTCPIRIHGQKLYYATAEYRRGYPNTSGFGYVSRLWEYDLVTGEQKVLLEDPFRAYEVMPDGAIVYSLDRKNTFGSILLKTFPHSKPQTLAVTDLLVDEIVGDGKRFVATSRYDGGSYGLYDFNPKTGSLKKLLDSVWMERAEGLYGDELILTSNIDKTYGIYSYNFRTQKTKRLTQGGYAVCGALDERNKDLYGIGLNENGADLYRYPHRPHQVIFHPAPRPVTPPSVLEGIAITKGGYGDNLKRMVPRILHMPFVYWTPEERFYGVAFAGGDAVYDFPAYLLAFGRDTIRKRPIGTVLLTSAFFSPLEMGGQYLSLYGEESFSVVALYPLALRLSPGLSSLWAGVSGYQYDDGRHREADPYLSSSFHGSGREVVAQVQVPIERKSWGSHLERNAFFGTLSCRQYLPGSQINVSSTWIDDPDNVDNPFGSCRGYGSDLNARRGGKSKVEYSIPFLKIRRGLWNPSLYAEDLVLTLFGEGAWGVHGPSQISYGAQCLLEGSVTTAALPLDLGFRYARTREGGEEVAMTVAFNLPFSIGMKPSRTGLHRPMESLLQGPLSKASGPRW
jgi:hypothetical protein